MSFSFDFCSKQSDAAAIIQEQVVPESVKAFLLQGISAFKPESLLWAKGNGHLFNGDYTQSSANIIVQEVVVRIPKAVTG